MAPEAVFFDMDGVTVDTAVHWRTVEREEILPTITEEPVPPDVIRARGIEDTYDHLAAADAYTLTVSRGEFRRRYDRWAEEIYGERATVLEGYRGLLEAVREGGGLLGLVSASPRRWVDLVLDRFDLHDAYDVILAEDDHDGPSKPSPVPYRRAADLLDVDPERGLAVEDSHHGVTAAVEAGMDCIALRGAGNRNADLSRADVVVSDPRSLGREIEARIGD
jgi:HAD superfamily hydrolase (TIGR01509 family)